MITSEPVSSGPSGNSSAGGEAEEVERLDIEYQAAVERNDAATMEKILADDFALVTGRGKVFRKADLLEEARSGRFQYEIQSDSMRTVRVWGGTAVVTALLHAKGSENGEPFDYQVWFSDTYARSPHGWRYVLGQSAGRLADDSARA